MVRAILEGRKTQTRRVVKYPYSWLKPYADGDKSKAFELFHSECEPGDFWNGNEGADNAHWQCGDERLPQNYQPGDHLWVRETWKVSSNCDELSPNQISPAEDVRYFADGDTDLSGRNRTAIFMPRWASRITLEITSVCVERLQDISDSDALAEGVTRRTEEDTPFRAYRDLWTEINGHGSWEQNPYVWVIEFKRL